MFIHEPAHAAQGLESYETGVRTSPPVVWGGPLILGSHFLNSTFCQGSLPQGKSYFPEALFL